VEDPREREEHTEGLDERQHRPQPAVSLLADDDRQHHQYDGTYHRHDLGGEAGAASVAGVGVAGMLVMLVDSLRMGLNMGLRAIIARSVGAGDNEAANHAAQQAFAIDAIYLAIVVTFGITFTEPILALMGLQPDVVKEGADYMRIMFVGRIPMSFWFMCETIMQASGDTINPMKVTVASRLFHVALCPFLIFGWWYSPVWCERRGSDQRHFPESGTTIGLWILFTGVPV